MWSSSCPTASSSSSPPVSASPCSSSSSSIPPPTLSRRGTPRASSRARPTRASSLRQPASSRGASLAVRLDRVTQQVEDDVGCIAAFLCRPLLDRLEQAVGVQRQVGGVVDAKRRDVVSALAEVAALDEGVVLGELGRLAAERDLAL